MHTYIHKYTHIHIYASGSEEGTVLGIGQAKPRVVNQILVGKMWTIAIYHSQTQSKSS